MTWSRFKQSQLELDGLTWEAAFWSTPQTPMHNGQWIEVFLSCAMSLRSPATHRRVNSVELTLWLTPYIGVWPALVGDVLGVRGNEGGGQREWRHRRTWAQTQRPGGIARIDTRAGGYPSRDQQARAPYRRALRPA